MASALCEGLGRRSGLSTGSKTVDGTVGTTELAAGAIGAGSRLPQDTGVAVWVSAHRLSAEAFKHDLARWFPELVGRVRIATPRGFSHSGLGSNAVVVCDDVDCWRPEDLRFAATGFSLAAKVGGPDDSGDPVDFVGRADFGDRAVSGIPVVSGIHVVSGIRLVGVGADRQGPQFSEAVAVWPGLFGAAVLEGAPQTPKRSRIICSHRSLASESVVQVLQEARRDGVAWHDMAVVVRSRGTMVMDRGAESELLGALGRSGRRSGIRFTEPGRPSAADPLVRQWLRRVDQQLAELGQAGSDSSAPVDALALAHGVNAVSEVSAENGAVRRPEVRLADVLFGVWERDIARLALTSGASTVASCTALLRFVNPVTTSDMAGCRAELRRLFIDSWVNPDPASTPPFSNIDTAIHSNGAVGSDSNLGSGFDAEDEWDLESELVHDGSRVAVLTPAELLGRQFGVVVVVGLAEGSWPTTFTGKLQSLGPGSNSDLSGPETFDANGLREGRAALAQHVANEEALFLRCVARATGMVVAVAAPEPGVLLSRFIEDWPNHNYAYPSIRRAVPLPTLKETPGVVPCFPNGRLRLSASQLSTFENCPQNFAYQYVAAVRGSGSVQASVGTMVHEALERYLAPPVAASKPSASLANGHEPELVTAEVSEQTEAAGGPLVPYAPSECGLPELLACLEDVWDSTAFAYRPQEADYRRRAEDWLRIWWENELPKIAQVVAVEHRFTINVGEDGEHVLVGSIDRVSIDPNGNLEIVDYKTGTPPGGTIDEEDLQLATYHLAVNSDPAFAGVGQPDRLRLHFLQNSKDIDQPIQANHAEVTSARIAFRANEILTESFRPSVDADCQYCAFQRACPIQPLGAEVGS